MIILKCSECGHESMAKDECTAEIGLNMHKCSVDFSKLSDADLLDRIRKESGKIGSAVYSDWTRRQTYTKQPWWYLDNLEITKTKGGAYRLWDIKKNDQVDMFDSLKAAKNHGLKLINQKRG